MLHIQNPSTNTLEALAMLPRKIQVAMDGPQVILTCPEHAPKSFIEWWAMLADDEGPLVANEWILKQFGVTQ